MEISFSTATSRIVYPGIMGAWDMASGCYVFTSPVRATWIDEVPSYQPIGKPCQYCGRVDARVTIAGNRECSGCGSPK